VNPQRPPRPGEPFTGILAGLWPQLGDADPRQYDMDKAFSDAATSLTFNPKTGQQWEAIPPDGKRALLRITCEPDRHFGHDAPMLAEVWTTNYGLLFISRLPGAAFDPEDDPVDPFAPPTAVLSKSERSKRAGGQTRRGTKAGWEPVPITIVRILLDGPVMASLWVKCADHGPAIVDRIKLARVYEQDQQARRGLDTPKPTVIRLHDVVAISSDS
jgi:hypothetical protein